jgi:hypothetical protein
MSARTVGLAAALAALLASCGGGDDVITEGQLRDCLAGKGLSLQAAGETTSAALGNVSADFRAHVKGGGAVDFVVVGTDEKARRKAADISGALQTFGVATEDRLVAKGNVIAVFDRSPSPQAHDAVSGCLD